MPIPVTPPEPVDDPEPDPAPCLRLLKTTTTVREDTMYKEPTALIGAISAAVAAILGLAAAFGLPLTDGQQNAILTAIAPVVVIIVIATAAIRSKVYSPASVDAIKAGTTPTV